jgi:RNA recognition motif-containing protein
VIWFRHDVEAPGIGSADRDLGKARAPEGEPARSASHRSRRGEDTRLGKKLYVGNLPYSTGDAELREMFEQHGTVESAQVINDRETGRSRGFGFVEMDQAGAEAAIKALDGQDIGGRSLRVNEAHERGRGGGGGRGPRQSRY